MTTAVTFGDYLSEAGNLDPDAFIGLLVMYSFKGARQANVTRDFMDHVFARHGLNPSYVPSEPSAAQAFQNATGEKRQRFEYTLNGRKMFAEIKAVGSDRDTITRVLWAFRVGEDKKGLDGREVGQVIFYKASGGGNPRLRYQLDDTKLLKGERSILESFLQDLNADYDWYRTYLYDQPIRQAIGRYIDTGLNGILLTSGGCYFVHRTRWTELQSLAEAVAELSPSFTLTLCPIPDLPHLHDTLVEAFENAAEQDVLTMVNKINERRVSGKLTPALVAQFGEDMRMIQARAEEHGRIFDVAQDKIANALEIGYEAIAGLLGEVEARSA